MFKVKYESGKYSRLVGKGDTREEAVNNLKLKINQKTLKDIFASISVQEIDAITSCIDCSICSKEDFDFYKDDGSFHGFTSYDQVENIVSKLRKAARIIEDLEGK
tara:strand:+ start:231 stop:545 length:315 start_codon:yes stop_codon:yes gene_type:complete